MSHQRNFLTHILPLSPTRGHSQISHQEIHKWGSTTLYRLVKFLNQFPNVWLSNGSDCPWALLSRSHQKANNMVQLLKKSFQKNVLVLSVQDVLQHSSSVTGEQCTKLCDIILTRLAGVWKTVITVNGHFNGHFWMVSFEMWPTTVSE